MGATSRVQYREFRVDNGFSDSRQPVEHIRVFNLQSIIFDLATRWWSETARTLPSRSAMVSNGINGTVRNSPQA